MSTPGFFRTPDEYFAALPEFPFAPHYLEWQGLRTHYLDERPANGGASAPVALLLHGEPTWSYLYRHMIPPLVAAGYRCIAPDYVGFGRSDKVLDDSWYVIERHIAFVARLLAALDLKEITLFAQDWAGPIGLINVMNTPERFTRLAIMNTWLHHDGFQYSDAIKRWRDAATHPAWLAWTRGDLPCGAIVGMTSRSIPDRDELMRAYEAPFAGNPAAKAGARRFPFCIPFAEPIAGAAALQAQAFEFLKREWKRPAHFLFGANDPIFPAAWGEAWSKMLTRSTFDAIENASHFVQEEAGATVVARFLKRRSELL